MVSERPTCLVIDAHPLLRLAVAESLSELCQVSEAATRQEAIDLIRDVGDIDVAVVDMGYQSVDGVPGVGGTEAIRAILKTEPSLAVVAIGARPDRHLAKTALQAGATGFIARTSPPATLVRAVKAALAQDRYVDPTVPPKGSRGILTGRQRQILQLIANGGSTTAAARDLGLSEETVKTHTKNALARLEAKNRTHAVAIALRESLID